MKIFLKICFGVLLFLQSQFASSQTTIDQTLSQFNSKFDQENERRFQQRGYNLTISSSSLNAYFGQLLNNFVPSPETPSTNRFTATLANEENSFDFGLNWDLRKGDLTKPLGLIVYTGVKVVSEKQNSLLSILDTDEVNSSVGFDLRFNFFLQNNLKIFGKKLWWRRFQGTSGSGNKVKNFRANKLSEKVKSKLKDKEDVEEKEVENTIVTEVADYISKNNLIDDAHVYWVNLSVFIPFNEVDYTYIESTEVFDEDNELTENFYNARFSASINGLYQKRKMIFSGTIGFSYSNNNNILTEELTKKKFVNFPDNPDSQFLPLNEKEIFSGQYNQFWTPQIEGEFTSILFLQSFGVSAAFEKNLGPDYDALNWRLGIPVSLKDKDGKKTINFELQWRELNGNNFVGFRVGKSFGAFIN